MECAPEWKLTVGRLGGTDLELTAQGNFISPLNIVHKLDVVKLFRNGLIVKAIKQLAEVGSQPIKLHLFEALIANLISFLFCPARRKEAVLINRSAVVAYYHFYCVTPDIEPN